MGGRSARLIAVVFGLCLASPQIAQSATDYPNKPVRLVVPFSAGGSLDILIRLLAQNVSNQWHQQILVENRSGADGDLGAAYVAHSPPDGYTLVASSQAIATNVALHPVRPYDVEKDLAPIMLIGSTSSVLFTSPSLHANSIADVIRAAKAAPGKLNYASQGVGTSAYLSMELFKLDAGIDVVHIPFNEYGQQTSALLDGQVAMVTVTVPQAFGLIGTGKLKPLAVSGARRSAALPDVPTMQEAGVPNYEATTWYGLYAAGGTPKDVIDTVNSAFKAALDSADVKAKLNSFGVDSVASTPDYLRTYVNQEVEKWTKVVRVSGMKIQ